MERGIFGLSDFVIGDSNGEIVRCKYKVIIVWLV